MQHYRWGTLRLAIISNHTGWLLCLGQGERVTNESYLTPSYYKLEVAHFVQTWEPVTTNCEAVRWLLLLLPTRHHFLVLQRKTAKLLPIKFETWYCSKACGLECGHFAAHHRTAVKEKLHSSEAVLWSQRLLQWDPGKRHSTVNGEK